MTDAELVEQARRGDPAAFDTLVERYQHAVFRAALAVTGRRDEAEEVAQDTFLRAYQHLAGFRGDASVKTWLLAIAWRQALSHRRSMVARLRRMVTSDTEVPFDPPASARAQDAELEAQELTTTVRRLVRALPAKYRDVLLLSASGDYTFDELSQILSVPAGTLKWRVSEARRRLREKLKRLGY